MMCFMFEDHRHSTGSLHEWSQPTVPAECWDVLWLLGPAHLEPTSSSVKAGSLMLPLTHGALLQAHSEFPNIGRCCLFELYAICVLKPGSSQLPCMKILVCFSFLILGLYKMIERVNIFNYTLVLFWELSTICFITVFLKPCFRKY